jgi:hypothetical protein
VIISERSVELLKEVVHPFESVDALIERLVRFYREHNEEDEPKRPRAMPAGVIKIDPSAPRDTRHTRLIKAVFAGQEIPSPNWNEVVRKAHELAFQKVGRDFDKLRVLTSANIVKGRKTDDGYSPLGDLGFSIQGVASNDAVRIICGIARKLNLPTEIFFEWRDKAGATYPGEAGLLKWPD